MVLRVQKYLSDHGIRPSLQRMAVMGYLSKNKTHPTADKIYSALVPSMPTLSRTTVYNTVSLLAEKGAILALDLDAGQTHYDGETTPHAHFICTCCGEIRDIFPGQGGWRRMLAAIPPPEGMSIFDTQLSYKGLCPKCSEQ